MGVVMFPFGLPKYKENLTWIEQCKEFTKDDYEEIMDYKAGKTYNIRIVSPYVLTQGYLKNKLGIGYHVVSVEVEKDQVIPDITDTITAMSAIIKTGYRALARANHPDLGGDAQTMQILNRTKKELEALLQEIS
jgi:hypothetical protein